jgi:hypothetical protein
MRLSNKRGMADIRKESDGKEARGQETRGKEEGCAIN